MSLNHRKECIAESLHSEEKDQNNDYQDTGSCRRGSVQGNSGNHTFPSPKSSPRKASFDIRSYASLGNSSTIRNLDDIKPFEEEAESTILRAIEKQDKERLRQMDLEANPDNSDQKYGILIGVPSEAIHLFSDDNVIEDHQSDINLDSRSPESGDSLVIAPTTNAPKLKDIVRRMQAMKMISVAAKIPEQRNNEEKQVDDHKDPESLQVLREPEDESDDNNIRKEIRRQTNHLKTFYRNFCMPCYSLTNFVHLRWKGIRFALAILLYSLIPLLGIAAILYYRAGNPGGPMGGSWSWWFIFFSRLLVCLVLAQLTQFIVIDFICLETQIAVRFIGKLLTLMAMQAKGWPVVMIFWSMWQLILLNGPPRYNSHWLYQQDVFRMFNEHNPAASIVTNIWYLRVLAALIILGISVMFKRVYISLSLGKKKYIAYGPKCESIMRKVLLLSEVALLAEDIEYSSYLKEYGKKNLSKSKNMTVKTSGAGGWLFENVVKNTFDKEDDSDCSIGNGRDPNDIYNLVNIEGINEADSSEKKDSDDIMDKFIRRTKKWAHFALPASARSDKQKIFSSSERSEIEKLLGEWEEPERYKKESWKDTSIQKVLEFRETLNYMDGDNPLSVPFGPASTRKECLKSSQKIYRRLLLHTPNSQILNFDTLLILAVDKKGKLNQSKARALIRLFRPDRQGNLTLLDFVRSCDHMYKRVKMFRATTANAAQLDDAFENLLNIVFYVLMIVVLLLIMQVDFLTVFSTLAGLILPLSFLFSAAASLYFQGVLLVLVRQPFDVGDRIALSNPMLDSSPDGSTTWFVEQITLFTTTVRNAGTNEVATYSNSSLAPLRIINAARSPKSITSLRLKFAIDVSLEKIKLFGAAVEEFVKERPREFVKLSAFRVALIEADLGYVQYVLVLQHQESWQNIGTIKQSLADVASFSLELSKKLDMRYIAPPMPVNLSLATSERPEVASDDLLLPTNLLGEGIISNEKKGSDSTFPDKRIVDFFSKKPDANVVDKKTV